MYVTHFDPQNLGENRVSSEFQQAMHFQSAYPSRISSTIDSTEKESQKGKMVKEKGFGKMDCPRREDKGSWGKPFVGLSESCQYVFGT